MIKESFIRSLIEEHLEGSDRFLVELSIKSGNRILVFIDSDTSVLIEHCISLSRHIESNLDRDTDDFELNVSSSGLDHPYKLVRQYTKNIGREIAVTMNDGTKISGELKSANDSGFEVIERTKIKKIITEQTHLISYADAKETKEIIKF
ncbi:MAG: ribosome assembly cofactor RimP [Bacteroidales bacterium]|nr:ribosome assembly cofactor RimP [Bacteroidales bacterium]MBK7172822.1 ribosome assembly cofactor RimP [Bacteroidales bacterium]